MANDFEHNVADGILLYKSKRTAGCVMFIENFVLAAFLYKAFSGHRAYSASDSGWVLLIALVLMGASIFLFVIPVVRVITNVCFSLAWAYFFGSFTDWGTGGQAALAIGAFVGSFVLHHAMYSGFRR